MDECSSPSHEVWLAVARAAADHRRITTADPSVFYGSDLLRASAEGCASAQRSRALRRGLELAVADDELVDALTSGDPELDDNDARELIEWERDRERRQRELGARIAPDLFGDKD